MLFTVLSGDCGGLRILRQLFGVRANNCISASRLRFQAALMRGGRGVLRVMAWLHKRGFDTCSEF